LLLPIRFKDLNIAKMCDTKRLYMDYERNRSKQNDEPSVGIKFPIPKSETDRGAEESSTLERQFERKSGAVLRNQKIERGTESNHQLLW